MATKRVYGVLNFDRHTLKQFAAILDISKFSILLQNSCMLHFLTELAFFIRIFRRIFNCLSLELNFDFQRKSIFSKPPTFHFFSLLRKNIRLFYSSTACNLFQSATEFYHFWLCLQVRLKNSRLFFDPIWKLILNIVSSISQIVK